MAKNLTDKSTVDKYSYYYYYYYVYSLNKLRDKRNWKKIQKANWKEFNVLKFENYVILYLKGLQIINFPLTLLRWCSKGRHGHRIDTQPEVQLCDFFVPVFFTAAIFLASGFGFTSFCFGRFELSQSILIHCPRSKVDNELFFFVKTTSTTSVYRKTLSMHAC